MPKLPVISNGQAVRVFAKLGDRIVRESKHTIMSKGTIPLVIPRHTVIQAFTMANIAGKDDFIVRKLSLTSEFPIPCLEQA